MVIHTAVADILFVISSDNAFQSMRTNPTPNFYVCSRSFDINETINDLAHQTPFAQLERFVDLISTRSCYRVLHVVERVDTFYCAQCSPLALKQHIYADCNTEYTGNFMENLDVVTPRFSVPKKDSLVFDFNEVVCDL